MKAVVKNRIRYKLIKYPKGIGLHDDKTVSREDKTVGVSTFRFGDNWFVTSKGRALFKAYNVDKQGIRIVNELLYDELANQINLPVAKYLPANYRHNNEEKNTNPNLNKHYHGLASIDVTKKNEKIMTGYQLLKYNNYRGRRNTFYDYIDALDYYKKHEN